METPLPAKGRRVWLTITFVLSPLGLALLWCALVDPESFGAFLLGIFFTILFGIAVIVAFLARKLNARSSDKTDNP